MEKKIEIDSGQEEGGMGVFGLAIEIFINNHII